MKATIDGFGCLVIRAAEPLVLHPRYHAMRVEALEPDLGIFVLTPVALGDRVTFERDGHTAGIVVAWVGDVMEQVDVDEAIAAELDGGGQR